MQTFPLKSLSIEEASKKQFHVVDCICRHFSGTQFLSQGDLGLAAGFNQPITTAIVENVIADIFNAPAACLVQGAGTGAIRSALNAALHCGETILVHDAPIYPTSNIILQQMGLNVIKADFNNIDTLRDVIDTHKPHAALVQHARQTIDDYYELSDVLALLYKMGITTIVDDNYAVMKVDKIGCELKGNLSTFSCFKLFGPQGVGAVVGDAALIKKIKASHYSGGCQIQGFQAQEVLRGLAFAPVMHAVQALVNDELLKRLNQGELPAVKQAFIANAQSKVLLVEFHHPIAKKVLKKAETLGALPHPVGAESKFELPPLFYRVSGTFLESDPSLEDRMIRINPNRSGADTVMRILQASIED